MSKGTSLGSFVNKVDKGKKLVTGKKIKKDINQLLSDFKIKPSTAKTFNIRQNNSNKKTFRSNGLLSSKYHLFLEKKEPNDFNQKLLSVKELDGEIVNVQVYVRK